MAPKKKNPGVSLRMKMGLVVLIGIFMGLLVAFITNFIGHTLIDDLFFSTEKMQENMINRQAAFQTYVTDNALSSIDSERINEWTESNGSLSLMIYKENKLILKTGETVTTQAPTEEPTVADEYDFRQPWMQDEDPHDPYYYYDPYRPPRKEDYHRDDKDEYTSAEATTEVTTTEPTTVVYEVYTGNEEDIVYAQEPTRSALEQLLLTKDSGYVEITFADGKAIVCFIDNSSQQADNLVMLISMFTSFLTFAILILIYYTKKVNQVVSLAHTVRRVGDGELDLPVQAQGSDEIALLADEVDAMRCSVAEKIENEKKASAAAKDLVTTMSHDIRTPLTALIGYLDIMEENTQESDGKMKRYLDACSSKAQQLKNLSDRLFNYFLVYGHTMASQSSEHIDARIFLEQVLGEQAQYLLSSGLSVQYIPTDADGFFYFDANEISRVFDNIFSNIVRYADRSYPVFIDSEQKGEKLEIRITNRIDVNAMHSESSGLGLKICSRLMEQCGGVFVSEVREGDFAATLVFPLYKSEQEHKKK